MRKTRFAIYSNLTANDNLYFTKRIEFEEVNGPDGSVINATKLFVTLHIRNVTQEDDGSEGKLGRYECHAFAVSDTEEKTHGFAVNVIHKSEIPTVSVPKLNVLNHGDHITITCSLTEGPKGSSTQLTRISWSKDGVEIQSVCNPDPKEPKDFLGPLELKNVGVRDGGEYECRLEVKLRHKKKHNVSDTTMVRIAAWLDKPKEDVEIKKFKGNNVSFVCAVQGFPLQVEWKIKKKSKDKIQICITESDGKYHIERRGIYDPYVLTVSNLQYCDNGAYYCCVSTNCSSDLPAGDLCQLFRLQVNGQSPPCQIHRAYLFAMLLFSMIAIYERSEL